jgi:hypothetical protein
MYEVDESHEDGCPLARPWLYDPNEYPLECICEDIRSDLSPEWTI